MRVAIFANGVIENADRAREAAKNADRVLAANGGARHCLSLSVIPDSVIGDIDSLDEGSRQTLEAGDTEFVIHPPDKDQTDLELALLAAVAHGAERITVLGAMGGRLDMTLANMLLLMLPELADTQVELWHRDQTAWLIHPPGGPIQGEPGDIVSLIPLGGDAKGVATQGLQFSLKDEKLEIGPARGISNVINGPNPWVEFHVGALLVVHMPNAA